MRSSGMVVWSAGGYRITLQWQDTPFRRGGYYPPFQVIKWLHVGR